MLLAQASAWKAPPPKPGNPNRRIAVLKELLQQQPSAPVVAYSPSAGGGSQFNGPQRILTETEPDVYVAPIPTQPIPSAPTKMKAPIHVPEPMLIGDDGSGLADFKPVSGKQITNSPSYGIPKTLTGSTFGSEMAYKSGSSGATAAATAGGNEGFENQPTPINLQQTPNYSFQSSGGSGGSGGSGSGGGGIDYNRAYSTPEYDWLLPPSPRRKTAMVEVADLLSPAQQKMDEKLSRILYLLEESRMEPTQYIGEEIALYTLLGAFVIGVLDSFVHLGKYVR